MSQSRMRRLDGLRALAFMAVFLRHAVHLPMGWMGVDMFFVLSGFLITGILIKAKGLPGYFKTFYGRRALRILPPYFLTLVLAAAFFPHEFGRTWQWYTFFAGNFLGAIHGPHGALAPLWSLAVEEQFYLLWPLAIFLLPERKRVPAFLVLLAMAPMLRGVFSVTLGMGRWAVLYLLPARMDLLIAGALLAEVVRRDRDALVRRRAWAFVAGGLAVFVYGVLTVTTAHFQVLGSTLYNVVGLECSVVFFTSVLWALLTMRDGFVVRALSWRPIVAAGLISYTMYLVHLLAIRLVHRLGVTATVPSAVIALSATIGVATASWFLLETPMARLKDRFFPEQRSLPSAVVPPIAEPAPIG